MRRFLQRSALTFLDRSGLSKIIRGGQNGWAHSSDEILNSRANLCRGKVSGGIAQLVERLVRKKFWPFLAVIRILPRSERKPGFFTGKSGSPKR